MRGDLPAALPDTFTYHEALFAESPPSGFGDVLQAVAAFADPVLVGAVGAGNYWDPTERAWHPMMDRTDGTVRG